MCDCVVNYTGIKERKGKLHVSHVTVLHALCFIVLVFLGDQF